MTATSKKLLLCLFLLVGLVTSASAYTSPSEEKGYFPLNGSCPATDYSGNSLSTTCNGGITTGVAGKFGSAYSLDGTDDWINLGNPSVLSASSLGDSFSVTAWANTNDNSTTGNIITHGSTSANDNFNLQFKDLKACSDGTTDGNVELAYYIDTDTSATTENTEPNAVCDFTPNENEWYFTTLTWDGSSSNVSIYLNGDFQKSESVAGSQLASASGSPWAIGSRGGDELFFPGDIDEARFYDGELNQTQIQNLYSTSTYSGTSSNSAPSGSNPNPTDGATNVATSTDLSIDVSDSDGDSLNATFKWSNGTTIEKVTSVNSGNTATTANLDLSFNTTYNWQVAITDGAKTTEKGNYSFTTLEKSDYSSPASEKLFYSNGSCPAFDFSGNNNRGTCNNGVTTGVSGYSNSTGIWDLDDDGSFEAWDFDGTDAFIDAPYQISLSQNFTMTTWFNTDSDHNGVFLTQWQDETDTSTNVGFQWKKKSDGDIQLLLADGSGTNTEIRSSPIANGEWHHSAVTYNAGLNEWELYVDGSRIGSKTYEVTSKSNLTIGRGYNPDQDSFFNPFDGSLDEVHIFEERFNQSEVKEIKNYNELQGSTSSKTVELVNPSDGALVDPSAIDFKYNLTNFIQGDIKGSELQLQREYENLTFSILSDQHFRNTSRAEITDRQDQLDRVNQFVSSVQSRNPDFVIQLGDLNDGVAEDGTDPVSQSVAIERLDTMEAYLEGNLSMPFYDVMGNHEYRDATWNKSKIRKAVDESWEYTNDTWYNFSVKNYQMIVLNTAYTDQDLAGNDYNHTMPQEEIDWLNTTMRNTDRPTMVFLHVPPGNGCTVSATPSASNYDTFFGQKDMMDILKNDDDFIGGFFGHSHHCDEFDRLRKETDDRGNEWYHVTAPHQWMNDASQVPWAEVTVRPTSDNFTFEVGSGVNESEVTEQTVWDETHQKFQVKNFSTLSFGNSSVVSNSSLNTITADLTGGANYLWNVMVNASTTYSTTDNSLETEDTSPSITVDSPLNQTYSTDTIDLNVSSSEAANFTYNVDGGSNTTVNENDKDLNTSLTGLSDGSHTVNVYATDDAGNTGSDSVTFTVNIPTGYIQINNSVQINQTYNNAFINVTDTLNLTGLETYSDATTFGGINWSIDGDTADSIDVKLSYFNDENPDDTYLANYSVSTGTGNVVTSTFVPRPVDSVYQVFREGSFLKQVQSDSNSVVDYGYEAADSLYKSFAVKRTDQFRPEINSTTYKLDQQNSVEQLELVIWARNNSNDILSSSGVGTRIELTNTSMIYDVGLPVSSTYSVTDTEGLTRNRFMDLSKSDSGVTENSSYSHNLDSQERIQELNITNSGDEWTLYNWTSQLGQTFTGNISTGNTETIQDTETNDFINNKTYSFGAETGEIVLGFNYTGTQPLEIENTVGTAFSDVSTSNGVGRFTECSQTNNSVIDVAGNELKNYSVGFNCDPGNKGTPVQSVVNITDSKERIWYNSTDMQINTNLTENNPIVIRANKSNLKNPDNRDGGSLDAIVEGVTASNSSSLNVSDTGSFFRVTVGTDFQASSLHTDDSDWSVTYTLSGENTTTIIGGGGGSTSESQVVYFGAAETEEGLETVSVPFGEEAVQNMTVVNERQSPVTAQVFTGDKGVCQYIEVEKTLNSDQFGTGGSYDLPAATQTLGTVESTTQFRIKYNFPNQTVLEDTGVTDYSCEFSTGSSYGTAEPLNIRVEEGFEFFGLFGFLQEKLCFEVPVDGVSSNLTGGEFDKGGSTEFCLSVWQIVLLSGVLFAGLYLLFRES